LPDTLALPILGEMAPGGLTYGKNYLVEFDPHSLWYEASLTIAADSVRHGTRTDYHTFAHIPSDVKEALRRLGVNEKRLEDESTLRIVDSYSVTALLRPPEVIGGSSLVRSMEGSLNLKDWANRNVDLVRADIPEIEKKRLHIDDNTSVLLSYNDEKTFIDHWRTNALSFARIFDLCIFHSAVTGTYSENFYRQFESLCDGVIEFKSREENETIEQYVRIKATRGRPHDSRWRRLRLLDNGEVVLDTLVPKARELGIAGWLKGPKKSTSR